MRRSVGFDLVELPDGVLPAWLAMSRARPGEQFRVDTMELNVIAWLDDVATLWLGGPAILPWAIVE